MASIETIVLTWETVESTKTPQPERHPLMTVSVHLNELVSMNQIVYAW